MIRLHEGDMREVLPALAAEGVLFDAVVTDPPYGLEFMGQDWDRRVAFDPATWALVLTVLRPGAFVVAFGGTRTYHRLVCAIEDAGFVIQDTVAWLYGSGFPKGRTMLKPAHEPIVLAYKLDGKRTLQVDECRIGSGADDDVRRVRNNAGGYGANFMDDGWRPPVAANSGGHALGRWPANVCHDGSAEVLAAFPQSAGQQGDVRGTEPSALTDAVYGERRRVPFNKRVGEASAERRYTEESGFAMLPGVRRNDGGSAARFFFSAKAGAQDRWGSRHPTVKPVELIRWLVRLVVPPGGVLLDPFAGSGTAAVAALAEGREAVLIEREAGYCADIRERIAFYEGGGLHSVQARGRAREAAPGPLFGGG